MSDFLNFVSNIVPITGDSLIDTFLFFIISSVAFCVAWLVSGAVADDPNSRKAVHWMIRILVFFFLLILFIGVVWLIKLIMSIPWWGWIIIGVVLAHIVVGIVLLYRLAKKKKARQKQQN